MNHWSEQVRCGESDLKPDLDRSRLIRLGQDANPTEAHPENRFTPLDRWQKAALYGKLAVDSMAIRNIVYRLPEDYLKSKKTMVMGRLGEGEWVSTRDVAAALIVDCLNRILPGDSGEVSNYYNLRGLDGLGLKDLYFGNAVVGRTWRESRAPDQLARIAWNLRRRRNALSSASVRSELGFLERERRQGTAHSLVQPSLAASFRNGILINNYSRFPIYSVDFGEGPPVWCDYPPFPVRQLAILNPDRQGDGVVVHLGLRRPLMKRLLRLPPQERHFDEWLRA
jgi:shikimate O-hydroxycinnamoyltransferase